MAAYRAPNGRYPGGGSPNGGSPNGGSPNGGSPVGRSPNGRPASGRPPSGYRDSGPMPAYRRDNSGPMPAYRGPDSGPQPVYRGPDSGPQPAYRGSDGGSTAAYRSGSGGYIQTDSGPVPAYVLTDSGPMKVYRPEQDAPMPGIMLPESRPAMAGVSAKSVMGWLPFGNRLVLLPRDDEADGELREHRDVGGGWLRPAVFGAMDGLVTNASLIAGVGGGGGAHSAVILTGIAGLVAGAFSMATGEFISVQSQNELTLAEVELERKQHARDPVGKLKRLTQIFMEKGVSPNLAEAVVRQISSDPERAVETHVREELGIDPDDLPSPRTAAVASLASFTVGALLPLSPFLLGDPSLKAALVVSGMSAFIGGAAVAKLTGRSMVMGGLRQFVAAALGVGAAFFIGHAVGGHVS